MDVIIIDDEPVARRTLHECCAKDPTLNVIGEFADGRTALSAIHRRAPDLVFLDIRLRSASGLQLARDLNTPKAPLIVFVTAYEQYAVAAFELNAADYLLKPFSERRFDTMMERVRRRHEVESGFDRQQTLTSLIAQLEQSTKGPRASPARLLAEAGGHMRLVDAEQIEAIEAARNYVSLHVGAQILHARSTLRQAEVAMQTMPLLRISRSWVVNLSHVREITKTPRGDYILILRGGTTVTSSEGCRNKVRACLEGMMLSSRRKHRDIHP